jgi:hypothetical protein
MNKGFVALLTLAISSQLFATDCKLDTRLTKKQLSSIGRADGINRVGLNRILLGASVYDVAVLNNKETNEILVMLGETHIKGPRSALLGSKVLKNYKVRMVEGVPSEEVAEMQRTNPELYDTITWKRKVLQILTFNLFGSTIDVAIDNNNSQTIGYKALNQMTKERDSNNEYSDKSIQNLKKTIKASDKKFVNFPIEFGDFLKPSSSDSYILHARNIRMAKNINAISEASANEKGAQLVVVGAAHLPGLVSLLNDKNFESCY